MCVCVCVCVYIYIYIYIYIYNYINAQKKNAVSPLAIFMELKGSTQH
jgi:hypothetical protein